MKKGTIKALAVSGGGNHIFRNGDKVSENQFPEKEFNRLVQEGFITPDEPQEEKSVKKIESELAEMEGFGDIDALVAGDTRKGVQEAAEARKTEIRKESLLESQKSDEEKAEKNQTLTLEKIVNAKTVGAVKAIIAGQTDTEILKAGAEKMETLQAAKDKEIADKKSGSKSEEKKETPKADDKKGDKK